METTNSSQALPELKAASRSAGAPFGRPLRERLKHLLRERSFWVTQLLVVITVGSHYAIEVGGVESPGKVLHEISVTGLLVAPAYAAFTRSWKSGVPTALWVIAWTLPSTAYWSRGEEWTLHELLQFSSIVGFSSAISALAWREQRLLGNLERRDKALRMLNDNALLLAASDQYEAAIPRALQRVRELLGLDQIWYYEGADLGRERTIAPPGASPPTSEARSLHDAAAASPAASFRSEERLMFPVRDHGRPVGSVGLSPAKKALSSELGSEFLLGAVSQVAAAATRDRLSAQRRDQLQAYAKGVTSAHEAEHRWLSRALQDEIAQDISELVRRVEALAATHDSQDVADAATQARRTLGTVRSLAEGLRSSILDNLGLAGALEELVSQAQAESTQPATFAVKGIERRLDQGVEITLYRIAQEALRNALRHAGGAPISTTLSFESATVSIVVADEGPGFEFSLDNIARSPDGPLGIIGMYERAHFLGANLSLTSELGKGTIVRVQLDA